MRCDKGGFLIINGMVGFNSRTCMRCDVKIRIKTAILVFQFTHLHEVRPYALIGFVLNLTVSIHAPA